MDNNPLIVGLHMQLGEQVMRLDFIETAAWNARNRGLYIAPELPQQDGERIATNVCLELAYISYGGAA